MNCNNDFDSILSNSTKLSEQTLALSITPATRESFRVEYCDYQQQTLPEQNAFKYIAGYLLNKCLKIHSCPICTTFANSNELDESNLFTHFKAYNTEHNFYGALRNPEESFYNYLFTLENIFFSNAHSILPRTHVGKNMYDLCRNVTGFIHPCDNFPLEYLLKLFIRLR